MTPRALNSLSQDTFFDGICKIIPLVPAIMNTEFMSRKNRDDLRGFVAFLCEASTEEVAALPPFELMGIMKQIISDEGLQSFLRSAGQSEQSA